MGFSSPEHRFKSGWGHHLWGNIRRMLGMVMETPEGSVTSEFGESRLKTESREFAARLFSRFPELKHHAAMECTQGSNRWNLVGSPGSDGRHQGSGVSTAPRLQWLDLDLQR